MSKEITYWVGRICCNAEVLSICFKSHGRDLEWQILELGEQKDVESCRLASIVQRGNRLSWGFDNGSLCGATLQIHKNGHWKRAFMSEAFQCHPRLNFHLPQKFKSLSHRVYREDSMVWIMSLWSESWRRKNSKQPTMQHWVQGCPVATKAIESEQRKGGQRIASMASDLAGMSSGEADLAADIVMRQHIAGAVIYSACMHEILEVLCENLQSESRVRVSEAVKSRPSDGHLAIQKKAM